MSSLFVIIGYLCAGAPLVHVAGHLVEDQPVPLGAVLDEVVDVAIILILAEISSHLPLDQQVAEPDKI